MVGRYKSVHRALRQGTTPGRSYSVIDTAGEDAQEYLRGQDRTDLPFKLSHYRPDGPSTEPLMSRILTQYDVC